jgi:hypothetical protein
VKKLPAAIFGAVLATAICGCASQPLESKATPGAGRASANSTATAIASPGSSSAASDSFPGYGVPCDPISGTPIVNGQPLVAQISGALPQVHGPFGNIGVRLNAGAGTLRDARIDVVVDSGSTPSTLTEASANDDQLSAGTEPGLAARASITGFAPGNFSLSLGALDTTLRLPLPTGTVATNAASGPAGTTASVVPVPSPPAGTSYTAYFIAHLDVAACNGGSPADGLAIEPLATLIP